MIACECVRGDSSGFTNLAAKGEPEWWVHTTCGKPTKEWLTKSGDPQVLNLFRGGPIDGLAHETTVLLSTAAIPLPIDDYKWTPEVAVSQLNGSKARVWVYKGSEEKAAAPVFVPESEVVERTDYMARRQAVGISRQEFADKSGVSFSQMERLERNQKVKPGTREAAEELLQQLEANRPSQ